MPKQRRGVDRRWSRRVTETSNALDLEPNVFNLKSPRAIATSLKRSAEQSRRRKAESFRSALSMLVFYINRAGTNLSADRKRTLERAKDELRALYGRPRVARRPARPATRSTPARRARPARRASRRPAPARA